MKKLLSKKFIGLVIVALIGLLLVLTSKLDGSLYFGFLSANLAGYGALNVVQKSTSKEAYNPQEDLPNAP